MKKILFIHHSTGGLLLRFGGVRRLLREKNPDIELWDHGYNLFSFKPLSYLLGAFTFKTGLSDQNGRMTGRDFNVTISNNSPKEYVQIFSRDSKDPTLREILKFDVIIIKNCYPTTQIETEDKLVVYKRYYSSLAKMMSRYENKEFIIFTPPPIRWELTKPEWALRARKLANYIKTLKSNNIRVFGFFDLLADKDGSNKNMLRREYCFPIPIDSHPNIRANKEIGKKFVDFLLICAGERSCPAAVCE